MRNAGAAERLIVLLFLSVPLSACSWIITATASHVANQDVSRDLTFNVANSRRLASCIQRSGGTCDEVGGRDELFDAPAEPVPRPGPLVTGLLQPLPVAAADVAAMSQEERVKHDEMMAATAAARAAREVLSHSVQRKLIDVYNIARGVDSGALSDVSTEGEVPEITIAVSEFNDYLDKLESATSSGSWDALDDESAYLDRARCPDEETNGCLSADDDRRQRAYIKSYFAAYFRHGHFFSGTIDVSKAKENLESRLKESFSGMEIPEADLKELSKRLGKSLGIPPSDGYVFGEIASEGLVTRGGQNLQVPSVEARFVLGEPGVARSQVDTMTIGADLIRVLLHAIFDAHDQLPGVSNSTGRSVAGFELPENKEAETHVSGEDFAAVETRASQIEAVTSAGFGRLIRGASFFSLNNEALATALETAVGAASRKYSEKVFWCWYSCRLDEAYSSLSDAAGISQGTPVAVRIRLVGDVLASTIRGSVTRR